MAGGRPGRVCRPGKLWTHLLEPPLPGGLGVGLGVRGRRWRVVGALLLPVRSPLRRPLPPQGLFQKPAVVLGVPGPLVPSIPRAVGAVPRVSTGAVSRPEVVDVGFLRVWKAPGVVLLVVEVITAAASGVCVSSASLPSTWGRPPPGFRRAWPREVIQSIHRAGPGAPGPPATLGPLCEGLLLPSPGTPRRVATPFVIQDWGEGGAAGRP